MAKGMDRGNREKKKPKKEKPKTNVAAVRAKGPVTLGEHKGGR